jgi:hypothetical protein
LTNHYVFLEYGVNNGLWINKKILL